MPLFDFKCSTCGFLTERIVKSSSNDSDYPICDTCLTKLSRIFTLSRTSFVLGGDGWAKDGYQKGQKNNPEKS